MNILNVDRLPGLREVALMGAVLLGGLIYSPSAVAQCWICAGRPDICQICQKVYGGMSGCVSSNCNCAALSPQCYATVAEDGSPQAGSCVIDVARRKAPDSVTVAAPESRPWARNDRHVGPAGRIAGGPSNEELRKLEEMKLEVARDAEQGLMSRVAVDYMKLFQSERRDEAWASRVESYIYDELAKMPLAEAGISQPIVRCASSVCEISVVQAAAASLDVNWQMRALDLMSLEDSSLVVADMVNFATSIDKQKNGYVSYLFFDR